LDKSGFQASQRRALSGAHENQWFSTRFGAIQVRRLVLNALKSYLPVAADQQNY
jgi:hypothetical protein